MTEASYTSNKPYTSWLPAWEIAERADDSHPFQVGVQVLLDGGDTDDLKVALLHDALEDGYTTTDEITEKFGAFVLCSVLNLTRKEGEVYGDYIERVASCDDERTRRVKLADVYVNLRRSQRDGNSLVKRYQRAFNRLARA